MIIRERAQLDELDFDKTGGLLPVVAQHAETGEILMLGYADREALEKTLTTSEVHFFSRSRRALWRKGETSGHVLALVSLHADCDRDALVALVRPAGPTCHTGARSCFEAPPILQELALVLDRRDGEADASSSYTARLLADRNLRLKKLAEEAGELALACADGDAASVAEEAADLLYHALVASLAAGVRLEDILAVLQARRRASEPN